MATIDDITKRAAEIRDNIKPNSNTAELVGGVMVDMAGHLKTFEEETAEELQSQFDAKAETWQAEVDEKVGDITDLKEEVEEIQQTIGKKYSISVSRNSWYPFLFEKGRTYKITMADSFKVKATSTNTSTDGEFINPDEVLTAEVEYTYIPTDNYNYIRIGSPSDTSISQTTCTIVIIGMYQELEDLKSNVKENSIYYNIDLEIGTINSGYNQDSTTRARTKDYLNAPFAIRINPTYRVHYIYRYDLDGNYIDSESMPLADNSIDTIIRLDNRYKYRLTFTFRENSTSVITNVDSIIDVAINSKDYCKVSKYYRQFSLSQKTNSWYRCTIDDENNWDLNSQYDDVIAAFNDLANNSNGYITKNQVGSSVGGLPIYSYTLKGIKYSNEYANCSPKIIIIAGQQGFEKSNIYGLYLLFKDLSYNWEENEVLSFIRENFILVTIPIVSPDSFNSLAYYNNNGVSLNRNYDTIYWEAGDPSEPTEYGGQQPFSEPETQAVRDVILANTDASLFIDFHTNGQNAVTEWRKVNWISTTWYNHGTLEDDLYQRKLYDVSKVHIDRVTERFNKEFSLNATEPMGFINGEANKSTAKEYANENNIFATTFEGFNGFVNHKSYEYIAQQACAELIGNFIVEMISNI